MRNLLILAISFATFSCASSKHPRSATTTVKEKVKHGRVVQRTTTTVEKF